MLKIKKKKKKLPDAPTKKNSVLLNELNNSASHHPIWRRKAMGKKGKRQGKKK